MEQAATVPVPYTIAYYVLYVLIRIQLDSTVVIHGASEYNGQALVQIARQNGRTVLTTAEDPYEKAFLVNEVKVPEHHIINPPTFTRDIIGATNGKGKS